MCRSHYRSETAVRRTRRKPIVSTTAPEKPAPANSPEWIVIDFDNRGFRCERCGATERHTTPKGVSRLESFVLKGQAFSIDHADCKDTTGSNQ